MQSAGGTLHSFLAILAGFVTVVVLIALATLLLRRYAPQLSREDVPADLFAMSVNIGIALVCGVAGGYVTALAAGLANPIIHALMLALAILLLGAFSALQLRGRQPLSYLLALTALPPVAVLCGGLLRLYQMGIRW
ncbi:hypothetical protein [Acidipila rosea]|uniref:Uncharacterized protein n=1 Tax=Acidipila rosea TaxID=768535 RepID=A0A4R1L1D6_9BACT|nr:hypothetical protein [Acidipila rosea]MBW4027479.1 hypothetical protein [Acidobacteriota bacterium]MBW4045658.1 hypothetical protein [Acidobacteriota bacterium]TCK71745.1 hypothetical protein C7378_3035 [Acidipila rosea]